MKKKHFLHFIFSFHHIWFYVLAGIPIFIFFPLIVLLVSHKKLYPALFWFMRNVWAACILFGMGFWISKKGSYDKNKNYVLIANHCSFLDIIVTLRVFKKPFIFIGKEELAKIPVFGFFYRRLAILVNRKDNNSQLKVYKHAANVFKRGISICIFPERTRFDSAILNKFKIGAFKMSINHKICILPIIFYDNKYKLPWDAKKGGNIGKLRVKIMKEERPEVSSSLEKMVQFKDAIYEKMQKELKKDKKYISQLKKFKIK